MESFYCSEKQGGERGRRGIKSALLLSLLIHSILLLTVPTFMISTQLPGMVEVEIVMESDVARERDEVAERGGGKESVPPLGMVRKSTHAEMKVQPPVDAKGVAQLQEPSYQKDMTVVPPVQEWRETSHPSGENERYSSGRNQETEGTARYANGGFSGVNGEGEGAVRRFREMVLRRIEEAKLYPERARRRGIEGDAFVLFTVFPDGGVEEVEVTSDTSCHTLLKQAAVRTVQKGAPYLPVPAIIGGEKGIRMKVKISFNLS